MKVGVVRGREREGGVRKGRVERMGGEGEGEERGRGGRKIERERRG